MRSTLRWPVLILSCLCGTAGAQSYSYSPSPLFASREGALTAWAFGARPQSHDQVIDGNLRSRPARFTAVSFRLGFHEYEPSVGMGRAWSNVTVDVGAGDLASASTVFTQNVIGTPTRVFQGSLAWPTVDVSRWSGLPPWLYSLPFSSPYTLPTGRDLVVDYRFAGGVLANRAPWTSVGYPLDTNGIANGTVPRGGSIGRLSRGTGCRDSASRSTGQFEFSFCHPGPGGCTGPPGQFVLEAFAAFLGPNTQVFAALTGPLNRTGVTLPAIPCEKLFADPATLLVLYTVQSDGFGNADVPVLPYNGIPWNPIYEGFEFGMQAFWNDSVTGKPLATSAAWARIPFQPVFQSPGQVQRQLLSSASLTAASGIVDRYGFNNPITRYTH